MKTKIVILILMAVAIVVSGCNSTAQKPIAGIVTFKDYPIGTIAPDIPFTSIEGKRTTFRKVKQPIAILAFTTSSGETCCRLVPELVTLAYRFRHESITVTQISLPTTKCPHGPGCVEYCNIKDIHLVSLCDVDRIAWKAYGKPEPNTVILVDDNNRIVAVESLENLDSIAHKAQRITPEAEAIEESMYEGG